MKKIRVAMLSSYSDKGGAAKATTRIYRQLLQEEMIAPEMITLQNAPFARFRLGFLNILVKIFNFLILKNTSGKFSYNNFGLSENMIIDKLKDFDVICLFWVNDSLLSLKLISAITKLNKPVLWRLSDMWPFTGGCHYSGGCTKFTSNCEDCPFYRYPGLTPPVTENILAAKKEWHSEKLTILCPSTWIMNLSQTSAIFKKARHLHLATGTETSLYLPLNKADCRNKFQIPHDKFVIGVVADKLNDYRKGTDLIFQILNNVRPRENLHIVFIGSLTKNPEVLCSFTVMGKVNDPKKLNALYNTFDVFIAPSREDNLPNTVLEAMSAGVPCIAFDAGGMKDLITHQFNGMLVKPYDLVEMSEAIELLMKSDSIVKDMGTRAREVILKDFTIQGSTKILADYIRGL